MDVWRRWSRKGTYYLKLSSNCLACIFLLNCSEGHHYLWGGEEKDYRYYHALQVVLTAAEVESLQSELAALEEREAHLKAQ